MRWFGRVNAQRRFEAIFLWSFELIIRIWSSNGAQSLYDSDRRVFRRWGWILANEPDIQFEFVPGSEDIGADLLSRPVAGKGVKDIPSVLPK